MRVRIVGWCVVALCAAAGCKESATDRAIAEARNRKPDAGVVAPVPPNATLLTAGQNVPRNLVADATHLYWLNEGLRAEGKAGIFRVSKSGGEAETLWEGKGVDGIVVAGDAVYATLPAQEQILRIPKSGGTAEPVVSEEPGLSAITTDGTNVYWTSEAGVSRLTPGGKPRAIISGITPPMGLAVDGQQVFFYSAISGDMSRAPASGGRARKFFNQELTLHNYLAHDGNLFWSLGSDKKAEIRRISASGGAESVVASGQSVPLELAADATHVYWTTGDEVMRAPHSGGTASPVVEKTDRSMGVAVDEGFVYWTDRGGRIQKIAK